MKIEKIGLGKFFRIVRNVDISLLIEETGKTVVLLLTKKDRADGTGFSLNPKAPKWLLRQLQPDGEEWEDAYFFPWNEEHFGEEILDPKFLSLKLNSIAEIRIEGRDWEEDINACFPRKLVISIYDKRKESAFPLCVTEVKYSRYSRLSKFIKFDEGAAYDERVEEYGKLSAQAES